MIESDPSGVLRIVLPRHDDLSSDQQPAFLFRAVKRRDTKRLTRLMDAMRQANQENCFALFDELEAMMMDLLVGWENQPIAFALEDFDVIVDSADLGVLSQLILEAGFGVAEKKGSGSQPPSPSVTSAAVAEPPDDVSIAPTPSVPNPSVV